VNTVRDYIKKLQRPNEVPGPKFPEPGLPHRPISVSHSDTSLTYTQSNCLIKEWVSETGLSNADHTLRLPEELYDQHEHHEHHGEDEYRE
jgi:hypothetical protein